MAPESNQASITGSTRWASEPSAHSGQAKVTSSMAGRCGSMSSTSRPDSSLSSWREPMQVRWFASQRQTGSGVPQNRSRDRAQSTLFSSHSPKRPSRMWPGCQSIPWFSSIMRGATCDVAMYHEGLPQ